MKTQKKALIYGFGPYGKYKHNVTVNVINQLRKTKNITTHIFETRFSHRMFTATYQQHQGDIIIGLGQDSRARKIRIERRAKNWRKPLVGEGRIISTDGPPLRFVSLKIPGNRFATVTYDAGDYVCNYSMYVMCECCQNSKMKFAFLHLPIKVDVNQVVDLIMQSINKIR